jgi:peptide/nickel transport system permease protein
MTGFVVRRIAAMIGILLALAAIVFVLQRVSPVDPARAYVGANATQADVAAARQKLGLNDSVPVQYADYVGNLVHGDLGYSLHTRRAVSQDLGDFLPPTLELIVVSMLLALLGGAYLGLASAASWRGGGTMRLLLVTGSAMPVFLLVLGAVFIFYGQLNWLPASGQTSFTDAPIGPTHFLLLDSLLAGRIEVFGDALRHLIIPATALAIGPAVAIGRVFRSSLIVTLKSDYVRTARAKGLSERRVLLTHAVRNSLGPVLAIAGIQMAVLLAADIIVESIVSWPGLGLYIVQSISQSDFPAIAGVTLVFGAIYVLVNALVDILQAAADPRITRV